jgi:hypothetical protein
VVLRGGDWKVVGDKDLRSFAAVQEQGKKLINIINNVPNNAPA